MARSLLRRSDRSSVRRRARTSRRVFLRVRLFVGIVVKGVGIRCSKEDDAPRLCRCRWLLSNQSKRWGKPWWLQASRLGRICTTPPTEHNPEVKI